MLRNRLLLSLQQYAINCHKLHPAADAAHSRRAKSSGASGSNATRQSKILGKFFGNRVAGSKKRWYPSAQDVSSGYGSGYQPPSVIFQASQFGKSGNSPGSKHNTRRMSVLNKLFMTHITDLLATGESAESILGRGMQVSRVKISSDFACVNVYWLGTGDVHSDASLEAELQRTSGQLRHELSQLRLMGEVPRIKFVRDKTGSNINNVEGILRTLNLNKPEGEEEEQEGSDPSYDMAQTVRQEFYGNAAAAAAPTEAMPEMRHDVLGLDHRLIMDKILTKMRKSKQSWEQHQQQQQLQLEQPQPQPEGLATAADALEQVQRKLTQAGVNLEASNSKFEAFLAKRRERKQTPERKKYRREQDEDWTGSAHSEYDELQVLSREQRERYTQEDYILEDDKDRGKL